MAGVCPQIQNADDAKVSDVVVFKGPPVTEQILWPRHCVQETWGAELHKDLKVGFCSLVPVSCSTPCSMFPLYLLSSREVCKVRWCAQVHPKGVMVKKGFNPDIDSYSAFFDNKKLGHTEMEQVLKTHGVTDVYCCGIAYDVCVGEENTMVANDNTTTPKRHHHQ